MCMQLLDTCLNQGILVFIDEDNLIENTEIGPPLGKNNHVVLEWYVVLKASEMDS